MKQSLSPASLSKTDTVNKTLFGDANYTNNPDRFPDSSIPQTGCSGTSSNVVAATSKFVQQPSPQMGGNYAEKLIPDNYPKEQHVGLSSPRQGYPIITPGKHNVPVVRDTNQYAQQFVNTLSGGKKGKHNNKKHRMSSTKSRHTYRTYKKNNKNNKKNKKITKNIKQRIASYRKTMKKIKNKTLRITRRGVKGLKNKTKKIKLVKRKYRGGYNVLPTFINEFNTTLTPDESGMASPTPLTRTYGDCTYVAN